MSDTPAARDVKITRLDHVQLAMLEGREDAARAFYVGILGFEEIAKPPELAARGGAWFRSGTATIHLGVEPDFRPARKAHPALRCADYPALLELLRARGMPIVPDDVLFEGRVRCYTADPFGNRIELISD